MVNFRDLKIIFLLQSEFILKESKTVDIVLRADIL